MIKEVSIDVTNEIMRFVNAVKQITGETAAVTDITFEDMIYDLMYMNLRLGKIVSNGSNSFHLHVGRHSIEIHRENPYATTLLQDPSVLDV